MITNYRRVCGDGSDSVIFDERIGLIWSDRVNSAQSSEVVVVVGFVVFRGQSEQQSGQFSGDD